MDDYRQKVYTALKGELGDSFTKSLDEFSKALDSDPTYKDKVYTALKGELGDTFTKTPEEFGELVKKKDIGVPVQDVIPKAVSVSQSSKGGESVSATLDEAQAAPVAAPTSKEISPEKPKGNETVKALKSSSARAFGGLIGLPAFITDQISSFVVKPIVKGLGYSDEEAEGASMAFRAAPIMGGTTSGMQSAEGQQRLNKYASSIESTMKQYEDGIIGSITEGFKNGDISKFEDAGAQLWKGAVQSLPYLAMTMATSGGGTPAVLATIGTTSASQRYGELQDPTSEEGKKLSETGKFANSWGYGAFEAAGELVTMGLANAAKKTFSSLGKEALEGVSQGIAKQAMKGFAEEGASEGATELSQQILDVIQGVRDNVDFSAVTDAIIVGGVTGAGLGGAPTAISKAAKTIVGRKVASDADIKKVNENNTKVVDLLAEKEKAASPEAAQVIDTQLQEVVNENNEIITKNETIVEQMTPEQVLKVNELDKSIAEYDARIDDETETTDPAILKSIRDGLQKQKDEIVSVAAKQVSETKPKEEVGAQTKEEIKPIEPISEPVEARSAEEVSQVSPEQKEGLKPDISNMTSDELKSLSDDIKQKEKETYSSVFGDNASRIRQIEVSAESPTTTRDKARKLEQEKQSIIDALPENKKKQWDAFLSERVDFDRQELTDLSNKVSDVESSENVYDLSTALKQPLMDYSRNKNKNTLVVFNAAIKRASELGIGTEELIAQTSKRIASQFKDAQDAEDMVKSALESITQPSSVVVEEQKALPKQKQTKQESVGEETNKTLLGTPKKIWQKKSYASETKKDDIVLVPTSEIDLVKDQDREVTPKWGKDDKTLDELTEQIKKDGGIKSPITVDVFSDGMIITEGNTRLAAAKRLGIEKIPVFFNKRFKSSEGTIFEGKTKTVDISSEKAPSKIDVLEAIKDGMYLKAIDAGEMTVEDAISVIESAGVKVPQELQQQKQPTVGEQTEVKQVKQQENGKKTSSETQGGQKGRQEELSTEEEAKVAETTGVKPKNLRDVYRAGREIFGLNKVQALAQAIITDRVVGGIAKKTGKTKDQVYSEIEYRNEDDLLRSKVNAYFQAAFHGSPHEFDKFTTEKIGTGEGAQAYGWGLYFTTSKDIAKWYANKLSSDKKGILYGVDIKKKVPHQRTVMDRIKGTNKDLKEIEQELDFLPWTDHLPGWQKSAILRQMKKENLASKNKDRYDVVREWLTAMHDTTSGHQVYKELVKILGSQKEASLFLQRAGIDGVSYLAANLPGAPHTMGVLDYNYVVFDENAVSVKDVVKFQKNLQGKRGAMAVHDGKALIYALTDPNVSTPLHEIAHVYERYMQPAEKAAVLKWTGDKAWTVNTSEKFARGFERYLAEGVAPTPTLQAVFERFKTWLTDIYNGIKNSDIDVELNAEMKRLYDSIITGEKYTPSKDKLSTKAPTVPKTEYKDVDDLLFQDKDVKFQGEDDKTARHTQALENLIAHKEAEGVEDVAKEVNDYLKAKGNPISQELIDKVLKEKGYAKGNGSQAKEAGGKKEVVKGEEGQVRVRDDGKDKKTEEGEVKERQQGKKIIASTTLPDDIKQQFEEEGIDYIPRGEKVRREEARQIASAKMQMEGGREQLKADIMDTTNGIKGDTRIVLGRTYVEDSLLKSAQADTATERRKFRDDATEMLHFLMVRSTDIGTELQANKEISDMLAADPEMIEDVYRKEISKKNAEFYAENKEPIKSAKQIIDDYLNSKEFKDKYKPKPDLTDNGKTSPRERRERGIAKIADAMSKIASMTGAQKNFVQEDFNRGSALRDAIAELASGILDVGVASTEELITKIKINTRKYLTSGEIDNIAKDIIAETDAANRIIPKKTKKIKLDKEDESKLVARLYGKMTTATEGQLRRLIADNIELFEREGSINDASFKELFAKALGKPYVADEVIDKLKKSAQIIFDVKVIEDDIKRLFDNALKLQKEGVAEDAIKAILKQIDGRLKDHRLAIHEAEKANKYISEAFSDPKTILTILGSNIQGNLVTTQSQLVNIIGNYSMMPIRTPKNFVAWMMDAVIAKTIGNLKEPIMDAINKKQADYVAKEAKKLGIPESEVVIPTYFNKYRRMGDKLADKELKRTGVGLSKYQFIGQARGFKEGIRQLWTGQLPSDIYKRDMMVALHPLNAMYENYQMLSGKEKMEFKKFATNAVEGLLSGPPEIMFRFLNLFDKPVRRGAELDKLNELANLKGIEGIERKKFIEMPDEASAEEARIAGDKATFQQDTKLSKASSALDVSLLKKAKESTNLMSKVGLYLAYFVKKGTVPFVKTPINVTMEMLDYALPHVSFAKGIFAMFEGDRKSFTENMGKAMVGAMINQGIGYLFATGIMSLASGGNEDEDKEMVGKKVKAAEYRDKPANYINTSALQRLINNQMYGTNESLEWRPGDNISSYRRFGILSGIAMAHGEAYKGKSKEEIKEMTGLDMARLSFMPVVKSAAEQSFVTGTSALVNALIGSEYERDQYLISLSKAAGATALPNTLRTYIQANDNYIRETKDKTLEGIDKFKSTLKSDFKSSFMTDNGLPTKVTIWGEPVRRYEDGASPAFQLFDITRTKKYRGDFGAKIFELYEKTKEEDLPEGLSKSDILPPVLTERMTYEDRDITLDPKTFEDYQVYVGTMFKKDVEAKVNSMEWEEMSIEDKIVSLRKSWTSKQSARSKAIEKWKEQNTEKLNQLLVDQQGVKIKKENMKKGVKKPTISTQSILSKAK